MKSVTVVMSTYNGEKYLKQQIDSILKQQHVDVSLLVRDDGSTDSTKEILKEYQKYANIEVVFDKNIGVGASFMEALCRCKKSDYYAFADQDDIWLKDKLITAVEKLELVAQPALYVSNQMLVDAEGKKIGKRYRKKPSIKLVNSIMGCEVSGCTMVFNNQLYDILCNGIKLPEQEFYKIRIHDAWVLAVANCVGEVIYDRHCHILYRQHEHNVVGVRKRSFVEKKKDYLEVIKDFDEKGCYRSKTAKQLRKSLENYELTKVVNDILWNFSNCKRIKCKVFLISDKTIKMQLCRKTKAERLKFKTQVILGLL